MKETEEIISENFSEKRALVRRLADNRVGVLTAFCALTTFLHVIWQYFKWGAEKYGDFINDATLAMTMSAAFFAAWRLSRRSELDEKVKRAWSFITLAFFFYSCGQVLWFYYRQWEGIEPFPSLIDVSYLIYYPLMLRALLSFPTRRQSPAERQKFWFDVVTVMIAGTAVVWHFIIYPTLESEENIVKSFLHTGFLVGDMLLFFGILTVLLRRPPAGVRRSLFLIIAGVSNLFIADITYAYVTFLGYENSGALVTLWVTGPFFFILAAYFQYRSLLQNKGSAAESEAEDDKDDNFRYKFSWIPYLAIGVGCFVLLLTMKDHWHAPLGAAVVTVILLTAIVVLRQITAVKENIRLHSERVARQSEMRFQRLIENSSDMVLILNLEGRFSYQSPSVSRLLGYEKDELVGRHVFRFIHTEDLPTARRDYEHLLQNQNESLMREYRFMHKDGSWRIVEGIAKILNDKSINEKVFLLNARDVNERKALESKLKHQAYHDALTNLANRVLFRNRVEEALDTAGKESRVAVLFLDLDNFKNINDTLGHAAGDSLLIEFAERLKFCVRGRDTVARLGGDEFAILLEGKNLDRIALLIASRILERVKEPFYINNSSVNVGISIGIAFTDSDEPVADNILRNADVAMYIAKGKGKNRFVVFENEMHRTILEQVELENDLRQAVELGELKLNYQPIVNLSDSRIKGVEALVRWTHKKRGAVAPSDFIPLAEQNGLIIPLGRQILETACLEIKNIFDRTGRKLNVTVNISAKQIQHPDFIKDISRILEETKISPENLILELTESTMMENTEAMLKMLQDIKMLGIRLAIDDFGTGYSSLSYLQQFPIDILKIDRSFVDGIENNSQKHAVARTIVNLGDTLGFAAVAEGIENADQSKVLQDLGCRFAQGYYFAKPMDLENLKEFLKNEPVKQNSKAYAVASADEKVISEAVS